MRAPRFVAAVAMVAGLGMSRSAWAGAAAKLTYVRGAGAERCAEESELRASVATRVGYDLFFPWARKMVVVQIEAAGPRGYRGQVQIVDERGVVIGQRLLATKSDDCADLTRALALTISIAVDDRSLEYIPPAKPDSSISVPNPSAGRPPSPVPATGEALEPISAPTPSAPVAPEQATDTDVSNDPGASRPPLFAVSIAPLVAFNTAPSPAIGGELDGTVRFDGFSLALGIRGDAPSSQSLAEGGGVSTWLMVGTLAPCVDFFSLGICGLAEVGSFGESGRSISRPRSESAAFAAVGGRVRLTVPLFGRTFFVSHADLVAVLTRHTVEIDGSVVFEMPAASLALGAGLGLNL